MEKPSLLYASPFPPMKSGISDYSTELVKALDSKFNITLFTDNYDISEIGLNKYPVLRYGVDEIDFNNFDYVIYNIGNNPEYHSYIYGEAVRHPGMVILHDLVIYYLFIGYYNKKGELYSAIYNKLGQGVFQEVKEAIKENGSELLQQKHLASMFPMNKELIQSGNKIMVHSKFALDQILNTGWIDSTKVKHINLIQQIGGNYNKELIDKKNLFKKYNIPEDTFIVSSFGYIAETKLNKEICEVIKKINVNIHKPLCYIMVGSGNYIDNEIDGKNIIKTGYTELNEFNSFIQYSDIVINLRYPSMGETSGAMLRILQLGKCCVTNDGGWFSEIPDTCVCKINVENVEDELYKVLRQLIDNQVERNNIGLNAQDYINDNYNSTLITEQISEFIKE